MEAPFQPPLEAQHFPPEVPRLRSVPTGELPADGPQTLGEALGLVASLEAQLGELERQRDELNRKYLGSLTQIGNMRADKAAEARGSTLWPTAMEAFLYWRTVTGHGKSEFSTERFFLLAPYLEKDGLPLVKLAIDGAAYDPYHADEPSRNGRLEVYDSLETIFKNRASFERHCNRAPKDRLRDTPRKVLDVLDLRIKAEAILQTQRDPHEGYLPPDDRPMIERVAAAIEQAKEELS